MPKKQKGYCWHLVFFCKGQKGVIAFISKRKKRIVIPFYSGKSLHPKIVKEVLEAVELLEN